MYSTKVMPKVDKMFEELKTRVASIITKSSTSKEAIDKVTEVVSSELATRSKSLLSDMLFDLNDALMETDYFSDIAKQNRFTEANLRKEILDKCQFTASTTIDYKEASSKINALAVGGGTLLVGGAIEVGYVLIKGLSLSTLVPIPISVLIVASMGAAIADYYTVEPNRSKKALQNAIDNYLDKAKTQFIGWFDEVENYYNKRVEEIKLTI
jgi:hypothetical protein